MIEKLMLKALKLKKYEKRQFLSENLCKFECWLLEVSRVEFKLQRNEWFHQSSQKLNLWKFEVIKIKKKSKIVEVCFQVSLLWSICLFLSLKCHKSKELLKKRNWLQSCQTWLTSFCILDGLSLLNRSNISIMKWKRSKNRLVQKLVFRFCFSKIFSFFFLQWKLFWTFFWQWICSEFFTLNFFFEFVCQKLQIQSKRIKKSKRMSNLSN